MSAAKDPMLSVVVPVHNEAPGLSRFNNSLIQAVRASVKDSYEIIYCEDGSTDKTEQLIRQFINKNQRIRLIKLSRNFGKEIALTSGLHAARGQAVITIDADGQHPVELIDGFLKCWRGGAKVVVGLRVANQKEGLVKRSGSKIFHRVFRRLTGIKLVPGSSDYRLIDRSVQQEFNRLTERSRITRGLIDWLGYDCQYIEYKANPRTSGQASYSFKKLFKLAVDSIISMTKSPLYLSAYLGAVVLPVSVLIGLFMVIDALVGDPLGLHATGTAYVVVFLLFLMGILLVSQGIIGLYLSHIHSETQNRPLYVIDRQKSVGWDETKA